MMRDANRTGSTLLRCAKLLFLVVAIAVGASPGHAVSWGARQPDTLSNPADEARARSLQKEFRCLVCQGQSLDESEAPLAADLRRLIRQRILVGDTNPQIERYLVARYGDFILMRPPLEPSTYALWLTPLILLLVAAAIALTVVLRAGKRARAHRA